MMDKFLEALAALGFLVGSHLVRSLYDRFKKRQMRRKHSLRFTALVHEKIKNVENEIMKVYRPLRMFIFHYYNGKVNAANMPVLKIVASHEITLYPGVKYLTEAYQGRPIPEKFYEGILESFAKGHYIFSLAHCEANPPLRDFFETWDVCSMLFIAIRNETGEPAATLVMQWPGDTIPINSKDINKIKADKIDIENIYAGRT